MKPTHSRESPSPDHSERTPLPWRRTLVVTLVVIVAGFVADGGHQRTLAWLAFASVAVALSPRAPLLSALGLAVALPLAAARSQVSASLVIGAVGCASVVGYFARGASLAAGIGALVAGAALALALDPRASFIGTGHNLVIIFAAGAGAYALRRSAQRRLELERAESELRQARLREDVMRELHDVAGYAVVAVLTQLRVAQRGLDTHNDALASRALRTAEGAAREAMDDLRGLALVLGGGGASSSSLNTFAAFRRAVAEATERFPTATLSAPAVELAIDPEVGAALLRVVQQSLANAAHHAPERAVTVELSGDRRRTSVLVSNERGALVSERGLGLGLRLLRERVERLGGALVAEAREGQFVVSCSFPAAEDEDADRHRR